MAENRLFELARTVASAISTVKGSWETAFLKNLDVDLDEHKPMKAPYKKSDLVYICISTTAKAISQIPLVVHKIFSDGSSEPVNPSDPWQVLFNRPNYLADQYSFTEAIVSYLFLGGNAWIVPIPYDHKGIVPTALYIVKKKNMFPVKNKVTGHLESWIYNPKEDSNFSSGEQMKRDGIELPIDTVAHTFLWNPYDPIMGMSPLEAAELSINTDYKAAYFNYMFFKNGAKVSGVLTTPHRLKDKQFKRTREQVLEEHSGYEKAHKMMILEQDLKYQQLGVNHRDMEFYDLRKFSQKRICQILGMKESVISETSDINRATALVQEKGWWTNTNLPIIRLIESSINYSILAGTGYKLVFDTSVVEALQKDFNEKVEMAERLSKLGFTANEINGRLKLGFDEKPWRDEWWGVGSMIPLSLEYSEGGSLPIPEDDNPSEQEEDEEDLSDTDGSGSDDSDSTVPDDPEVTFISVNGMKINFDDYGEKIWKAYIKALSPVEKSFENKVKRIFFDMRKQALTVLMEGSKTQTALDKTVSALMEEEFVDQMNRLKRDTRSLYSIAVEEGIVSFASEIGIGVDFTIDNPIAIEYLTTKISKIVGVTNTVKNQISNTLANGMELGESIEQLADRIRLVFNASFSRAKTIARTEVIGSSNFGRWAAIESSGFKYRYWYTAADERVRRGNLYNHIEMHGQRQRVGEPWHTRGGDLYYPGDWRGAAGNIINCRCIEVVEA